MGKIHEALIKANQIEDAKSESEPMRAKDTTREAVSDNDEREKYLASRRKPSGVEEYDEIDTVLIEEPEIGALDKKLIAYHQPHSMLSELLKIIRTNLLHPPHGEPPRSILITSATPGEGKSFISGNLAITIAQGVEEHVLMIDADVRHPTLHSLFGMQQTPGLSDVLGKGVDVGKAIKRTAVPKLSLIPGGEIPPNPSELLSSKQMAKLLKEARERYDDRYIIVDSPPPNLTAETNALARIVDGIIIVIRAGKTSVDMVEELVKRLGKDRIVGVVMNSFDMRNLKNYSNKKYGKYYYHSK